MCDPPFCSPRATGRGAFFTGPALGRGALLSGAAGRRVFLTGWAVGRVVRWAGLSVLRALVDVETRVFLCTGLDRGRDVPPGRVFFGVLPLLTLDFLPIVT